MKVHTTLKLTLIAALVATQAAVAGSAAVKPVAISYREVCYGCGRVIYDRFVAAETIDDTVAHKFRTIRCMLAHLTDTAAPVEKMFVADYESGTLLDVDNAVFVPIVIDAATAIEGDGRGQVDYAAFRSPKAAERFAARHGVTTMSWPAVVYDAAVLAATNTGAR